MAANRENAFGMLYAAFEEVHRYLAGLPVEGVDIDFPPGPIRHDAPESSTQPACTEEVPVVPPSTSTAYPDPPCTDPPAAAAPPPTSLSSTAVPVVHADPAAPPVTSLSSTAVPAIPIDPTAAAPPSISHAPIASFSPSTATAPLSRVYTRKGKG